MTLHGRSGVSDALGNPVVREKVKPKLICTNCGKKVRIRIFGLCLECSEGAPE